MRLIPVLDVQGGVVVRGVGGQRHAYRPLVSRLIASCEPAAVARALADILEMGNGHGEMGTENQSLFSVPISPCPFPISKMSAELYLADLDAIAGAPPAFATYAAVRAAARCALWVDAGVRDLADAERVAAADVAGIVVGLETVRGPEALTRVLARFGERAVFSLDLREGRPLGELGGWPNPTAEGVAEYAVALGARRLIVLDLARVGGGGGTGTEALCRWLKDAHPTTEVIAGGGVRDGNDLTRLERWGADAVLVASALHDGRLG